VTTSRGGRLSGIDGVCAVITGAANGIGAAHADAFASAGASVACLDIDKAGARRVADGIARRRVQSIAIHADVTSFQSMREAAATARETLGPCRHLIANAGIIGPLGPTADTDENARRRTLDVDVTGVTSPVKAFVTQVCDESGTIMIASLVSGLRGWSGSIAYHASKHAVIGPMRSWANDFATHGVRVNAVYPGRVDTAMIDIQAEANGLSHSESESLRAKDQLVERFLAPQEVADAVIWVSSDPAAMVNAVALPVDGGLIEPTMPS